MSRIKVGIIGYGGSAKVYHLPFILSVPELELHAFLQRAEAPRRTPGSDIPRGQHCTIDFPGTKHYRTAEAFFADEEIELVVICTGPATHAELALQAINAGKNVVVEKPFTCTSAEADEVIQAATRKGVILTVYQNRRYDSDFLALQDVIDRGYLGTISEAEFHHDLPFPAMLTKMTSSDRRPGMGMAYTAGSHSIDQALSLFGRPRGVTAFYRSLRGIQSDEEDSFTITLSYDSPLLVHIKTNAQTMMNRPLTYFVRGSTGAFVKFGGDVQIKQIREKGMSPGDEGFGEEPEDMWGELTTVNRVREGQVGRGGFWVGKVPSGKEGYQKYYRDLVETLQGRKKLAIDPVLSRNGIRVIELATQSAKEGRTLQFA